MYDWKVQHRNNVVVVHIRTYWKKYKPKTISATQVDAQGSVLSCRCAQAILQHVARIDDLSTRPTLAERNEKQLRSVAKDEPMEAPNLEC